MSGWFEVWEVGCLGIVVVVVGGVGEVSSGGEEDVGKGKMGGCSERRGRDDVDGVPGRGMIPFRSILTARCLGVVLLCSSCVALV